MVLDYHLNPICEAIGENQCNGSVNGRRLWAGMPSPTSPSNRGGFSVHHTTIGYANPLKSLSALYDDFYNNIWMHIGLFPSVATIYLFLSSDPMKSP